MIEIKTKILEVKNASVEILQEIYKDEILFFKMELTLAFIKNEKPARMDMQLKSSLKNYFNSSKLACLPCIRRTL